MDIPPLTFSYKTYRLSSKSNNLPFLAGKYAALSQQAVTTDPHSFGVAYSTEGTLSPSDYLTRLSRPNAEVFVCVAHPGGVDGSQYTIEQGTWVGMVTQIGPTPKETYWLKDSGAPEPLEDAAETKWHQTATWISPAHRGKGIGKQLVDVALAFAAESITGSVVQTRVRAFTGPGNEVSKRLYGSSGFAIVGRCTILEAMLGNGNAIYPFHGRTVEEWGDEIMSGRYGIIMERVIRKVVDVNGVAT